MSEVILSGKGLCKKYVMAHQTIDVLKGAELEARKGELVAVIGRSGAGKSTLLNILGGIDMPDSGEVSICGISLFGLSTAKRTALRAEKIGYVFQTYHLLPEMTILENVMLPAMALGRMSNSAMNERAMDLLRQVGLDGRAGHRPAELSGGEQQRAAIARALVNHPVLILADEPTGNLDRATGSIVLDLLFKLVRQGNSSMLIVTHDPTVAQCCDRILTLTEGIFEEKTISTEHG